MIYLLILLILSYVNYTIKHQKFNVLKVVFMITCNHCLAAIIKRTKFATLIGTNTAGGNKI